MNRLFQTSPELISSGIPAGVLLPQRPLWKDGENVRFAGLSAMNRSGTLKLLDTIDTALDLEQAYVVGQRRLYAGTATKFLKWNEGEAPSGTEMLSGSFEDWSIVPWGNWVFATDGALAPQISKNTGTLSDLASLPFDWCKILAKLANHLIALNTSNGGNYVEWSDFDDPEEWTQNSLTVLAGYYPIRDLSGEIRAAEPIGPRLAIYAEDGMQLMSPLSNSKVFGFQAGPAGPGASSKHSVISYSNYNWGLTRRGVWRTDGIGVDHVDEPQFREWLRREVNWDRASDIRGWFDETNDDCMWAVPVDDVDYAVISVDRLTGAWSFGDPEIRNGAEESVFSGTLLAFGGEVHKADTDTLPAASFLQTIPLDCGDREFDKQLDMVRLDMVYDDDVQVGVGFTDTLFEEPLFEYYPANKTIYLNTGRQAGAFIHLRIAAPVSSCWRLGGFSLHGEVLGNEN